MNKFPDEPHIAFMYAATTGKIELLAALLEDGIDINVKAGWGMTALHWAASAGQLEAARFLLSRGAIVTMKGNTGITPLMEAVSNGHIEIVTLLLAAGADVNLRVENTPKAYWRAGRTSLNIARNSPYLPKLDEGLRQQCLIALLQEAGGME